MSRSGQIAPFGAHGLNRPFSKYELHTFFVRPALVSRKIWSGKWAGAAAAFDRPIGLLIMAACASNSIYFPRPASRRIVLCR
jgi:hypothetical protein